MPSDKLQIRLNPEQKMRLKQIAKARQVTATDVIKDAIAEQWFKLKIDSRGLDKSQGLSRSVGYLAVGEGNICEPSDLSHDLHNVVNRTNLSEAVAATWEDEEVRAKRSRRWGCRVTSPDGQAEVFDNVRQAYEHVYGRDTKGRHIKFRTELVNVGNLERDGRGWEVFRKN